MSALAQRMTEEISQRLVGTVITQAITDGGESFGFEARNKDERFVVWVECDPEGNGPGFLQIEEVQK